MNKHCAFISVSGILAVVVFSYLYFCHCLILALILTNLARMSNGPKLLGRFYILLRQLG
jgi:hypothetical protein